MKGLFLCQKNKKDLVVEKETTDPTLEKDTSKSFFGRIKQQVKKFLI